MEDHIINLVVAVHERAPVLGLRLRITEESDHGVLVRDLADGDLGLLIDGFGLRFGDCVEGGDLAVVEARGFAVALESDVFGHDAVEFGERGYGGVPPFFVSANTTLTSTKYKI
jgi:hypothetical protein